MLSAGTTFRWLALALLVAVIWMAGSARADVYGPPVAVLNSAQSLLQAGGVGPGARDILFNGVPMKVYTRYDSRTPLSALQRSAGQLRAGGSELRAFSSADGALHALVRVPRDDGEIGLTLAWRSAADSPTTLWDVALPDRKALLALFGYGVDLSRIPKPAYLEPAPGAKLALDLVDRGDSRVTHTRVFDARGAVRTRVDYYTGQLQQNGFELSQDAGFDGSSWLRSFRGPQGTLNLFVRAPIGGEAATDVLQFHSMR